MELRYHLLDVFTDQPFGGNQLAVFVDAPELPDELMQQIARELNLSETVFVRPATGAEGLRSIRIFTPGRELPFAGHPTIGTAHLLAELGIARLSAGSGQFILEERVGPIRLSVSRRDGAASVIQLTSAKLPEFGPPPPPRPTLAAMLGIEPGDLAAGIEGPEAVSCGVPYLLIPVKDRGVLARISLDLGTWREALQGYWTRELFVFCRDPEREGSHLRARMFAPEIGIVEDPATGSAAVCLAGYLAKRDPKDGVLRWTLEQGFEMGRPSILYLEAEKANGRIAATRVGGTAVRMGEGVFRLSSVR